MGSKWALGQSMFRLEHTSSDHYVTNDTANYKPEVGVGDLPMHTVPPSRGCRWLAAERPPPA